MWVFRILALAVSLLVVFGVAELFARLSWDPPPPPKPLPPDLPVLRSIKDLNKPNIEGAHKRVRYRTNSRAFRGPEWSPRPGPGVFRILVTGDSITVGSGVDEEDRYTQRLEKRLQPPDGTRYEVLNTALAGLNIEYAVNRLKSGTNSYEPELLVYGFSTNDIEGEHYVAHESTPGAGRKLFLRTMRFYNSPSYLLRSLWPRWVAIEQDYFGDGYDKQQEILENYFENPAAWTDFLNSLQELARFAKRKGLCAHVFVMAAIDRLDSSHRYHDLYDLVADAARDFGMTASGSFEVMAGKDERSLWVSPTDSHPNSAGHELLADALYAGLQELPDECWRQRDGTDARPLGLADGAP